MMTFRRIALALLKILIYVGTVFLLMMIIYYGINKLSKPEDNLQNTQFALEVEEQNYSNGNEGNRISAIVGTASVLMAVLSMLQQHISRYQDRVLAFPKMILSQCQFYIGENAVEDNTSFYNDKGGKLLIKINFEETFSPCYVPCIYRVKCAKDVYGSTYTWLPEKLCKVLGIRGVHKQYVALEKRNAFSSFGKEGLCMEVVINEPELIQDYCEKMCGTRDYKLDLVIDVCWKNELLMFGLRNMSNMYLRYELRLDDLQRCRPKDNYYFYKIENVKVKGAPLW